ncbi:MAG: hypothetical protein AAF802_30815 [Planctomycetota bacterium]
MSILFLCLSLICIAHCIANEQQVANDVGVRTVKRGLTTKFEFAHSSGELRAIEDQSIDAPVLVRLERDVASPTQDDESYRYTLWFFGAVAGDYQLADYVLQGNGLPLADAEELSGMSVRVVSELPPGRGTNLYEIDDPPLRLRGGYRAVLVAFGLTWFSIPVIWGIQRARKRTEIIVEPVAASPTLADKMRPLVQRAYEGKLSVEEQSRLELVLYKFWQQRVGLPESVAIAIPVLRQHSEAGQLLRSFEAWVHAPENSRPELDAETLDDLLQPYRIAESTVDDPLELAS